VTADAACLTQRTLKNNKLLNKFLICLKNTSLEVGVSMVKMTND
jgi:hypothetical protein